MTIKERIEQDLKTALLSGDQSKATTLRGLKSVILNEEIDKNKKDSGLNDQEVIGLFQKEVKKRQESADLYVQGHSPERAAQELKEKALIEGYLPAAMPEAELNQLVGQTIDETQASGLQDMGKVIGLVKSKVGGAADGATIARLVKEKLT